MMRPSRPKSMTGRRQQAIRAVLGSVISLLLLHLLLNGLLDTQKPEWRDPEWGWRLKRLQKIESNRGDRPLCLVLGSSRAQMGFSPKDLGLSDDATSPVVYNLAQPGAGPLQMWLTYERVRARGIRPQSVLIEIMPAALATNAAAEVQFRDTVSRLAHSEMRLLYTHCDEPGTLEWSWWKARVNPWWTYRFLLLSHTMPTLLPWQQRVDYQWRMLDDFGWLPFPFDAIPESYRSAETARVVAQYQSSLAAFQIMPKADAILRDLIDRVQRDRVQVALFRMPEARTFRSLYPADRLHLLDEYLACLCTEKQLPLFDATNWLSEEFFSDGHHLMKHGARKFSRHLGKEHLLPWLMQQNPLPPQDQSAPLKDRSITLNR